jgi:surfactin synthase thioesterase subunit
LRRRGITPPVRFYVGGSRPPHIRDPLADAARGDDETFIARLAELGGTPSDVFAIPELRELVMPALRADFAWFDAYTCRPEPPLATPIVALAGTGDTSVPVPAMLDWARHTSAGFRLHRVPGDHFFVQRAAGEVAKLLLTDLRDALDDPFGPADQTATDSSPTDPTADGTPADNEPR